MVLGGCRRIDGSDRDFVFQTTVLGAGRPKTRSFREFSAAFFQAADGIQARSNICTQFVVLAACAGVSRSQLRRHASFPLFLKIDVSDSLAAVNDKLKRARQLLALQLTSRPTPRRETQGGAYTDGQDDLGAVAYHDFLNPLRSEYVVRSRA